MQVQRKLLRWKWLHECSLRGQGLQSFLVEKRLFEQAPRVDRPPQAFCCAALCSRPATQGQRSKDQISQTAHLGLQSYLVLIWSSDPGCLSYLRCGYRTRKPLIYLAERRQGSLHCNGFRVSSPMLQCCLRKRRGALGVVLGTFQYIVGRT